ncbi:Pnap_2097 family protein [Roseinatronobacter alkalisoli]|uniref:Biosynthetic protein (TIGR04099 family) n=1 Tax=Roseinatronobacter alkalisoli TaxID=3028235 RepID=A0ABT5TDE1_9RHOB|nr:Pnap_2097 family protein [Roseinatronobacter sp. HJB301]MDD7973136.1 hypothetical protein [Roseinatronobacter sp. HJB301]
MTSVAIACCSGPVFQVNNLMLGMAQLAPAGLSEQWLLRYCGDEHWRMVATALGQNDVIFRAADGRPVYAAFCTTSLKFHPAGRALLGQEVRIASALHAVSDTRTGSCHMITSQGGILAELRMISTFVSHDNSGSNKRIVRNSVLGQMHLPAADAALARLDCQARAMSRKMRLVHPADSTPVYAERPIPSLDFNAVGLLYFPTFSRLAETAEHARPSQPAPLLQRDVVYLGNLDQGDTVQMFGQGKRWFMARQDGALIAAGFTRRGAR